MSCIICTEIIEEKDANLEIKKINEINTGIICIKEGVLRKYLKLVTQNYMEKVLLLHTVKQVVQ